MEKRQIGHSSLRIAPWVLGGNVFGWTADEKTSHAILDEFVAAEFNCIDTANVYSRWKAGNKGGESETIIGNWLKKTGKRSDVIIATKVGMEMGADKKGLKRNYIIQEVEASLKRLQTDYIDLYFSHQDDFDTPLLETLDTYATLIKEGKVRAIGASNFSPDRLTESLILSMKYDYPRYECLQPEYNLYERSGFEKELQEICIDKQIGVVPYYSLASGFLTGKYRTEKDFEKSARSGGVKRFMNDKGNRILATLDEVAVLHNATPAQIALAWLLVQPGITAPIASVSKPEQVQELAKAATLILDITTIAKLNAAGKPVHA
ncbi:MAG: aldo/keto reductase [Taibaiella sp.]|nr:aldo/keto reductase [Taibaiella sp.]